MKCKLIGQSTRKGSGRRVLLMDKHHLLQQCWSLQLELKGKKVDPDIVGLSEHAEKFYEEICTEDEKMMSGRGADYEKS